MSLWVDTQHPRTLDQLDLHPSLTPRLRAIAHSRDFPHLLFTGPPGSGKRTRVSALLRELFDPDHSAPGRLDKLKLEHKSVKVTESKTVEVTALTSPYHTEMNLSELGSYDRAVVMTTLKEIAQSAPIVRAGEGGVGGGEREKQQGGMLSPSLSSPPRFRVLVLHEVDRMTRPAQQALRRTMEKCVTTCRLVLVAESTGRLIAPIRSRCLEIRVPCPQVAQISLLLDTVLKKEGEASAGLTTELREEILQLANGNVRRSLLLLESAWKNNRKIHMPTWQTTVRDIATCIVREQTPKKLHEVRGMFYDLLGSCIPPGLVFQELLTALLKLANFPESKSKLVEHAATYDHSLRLGSKPIFHLEAFAAHAMAVFRVEEITKKAKQ